MQVEADKRDGNRTLLIRSLTKTTVSWKPAAEKAMSAQLKQMKSNVVDEPNDFFMKSLDQSASFFTLAVCAGDSQAALKGLKNAAPGMVITAISVATENSWMGCWHFVQFIHITLRLACTQRF
eukprot:TRINITY_DN12750_c0_g1_i2.p2 TRINITY_DN12750_c0_g1~~TRINITY_DN12750_c0_g1_i2.p2  ORF type:complete len:123 (-),score=27.23 TRINITY_DN12750_c0_g1_i2:444-812(-)